MKLPLNIGHRGSPESATENTEESFRAALNEGAVSIETDVRITLDGHIVVSHDSDFSRLGGPSVSIRTATRAQVADFRLLSPPGKPETVRPLFLDEALEMFPYTRFSVDLKDSSMSLISAWVKLLKHTGAANRCRTASFSDATLRKFHRLYPAAPVSLARYSVLRLLLGTMIGLCRSPRPWEGVLQLPETAGFFRIITPSSIRIWQRRGWQVQVWTIDTEEDMRRLVNWGVDGIITNKPSMLARVLDDMNSEVNL